MENAIGIEHKETIGMVYDGLRATDSLGYRGLNHEDAMYRINNGYGLTISEELNAALESRSTIPVS